MTPVIWYDQCKGNWDHGTLMEIFDKHPDLFPQFNQKERLSCFSNKAIIIVAGKPNGDMLFDYLQNYFGLMGGIVILTSEEDAYFDWKKAIPSKFEIWTQYYSPSTKSDIKTRLLLGAPHRIKDYKINKHLPKKYLWSFVGQVQNPFRQSCVDVLKTLPDGFLRIVEGFGGQGEGAMEYQQYLDIMCESHYVICPAGSMCVDSFRLYEAIECGSIPITDCRSPRDNKDFCYWEDVCPAASGILSIMPKKDFPSYWHSWNDVGDFLRKTQNPPHIMEDQNYWWFEYKKNLEQKLLSYANG